MHILVIIACGIGMLAIFIAFGWLWHIGNFPSPFMQKLFIIAWIVISVANMWIGVSKAGYPFAEELVVLPQVLIPPVIAACLLLFAI